MTLSLYLVAGILVSWVALMTRSGKRTSDVIWELVLIAVWPVALAFVAFAAYTVWRSDRREIGPMRTSRETPEQTPGMRSLWKPIKEITIDERYNIHVIVCAPELVDLDCNPQGVAPAYFQDERDVPSGPDGAIRTPGVCYDGWIGARYDMHNDEWHSVSVTPTHYIVVEPPIGLEDMPHHERR